MIYRKKFRLDQTQILLNLSITLVTISTSKITVPNCTK